MSLRLGSVAPNFVSGTTMGDIDFYTWKGTNWALLFSHPQDFTPVCTTELGNVAKLNSEWQKRNVKVIGLSCNSLESHQDWIRDINETQNCRVDFPIIADHSRKVAALYDMLDYQDPTNVDAKGMPYTVRSVFFIDPLNVIRAIITYPASTGRNFNEILRVLDSLLTCDEFKVTTPANWTLGQDVIIPPTVSDQDAERLFPGYTTIKPYLRTTSLPK
jgi:alkyl hydroperoxide reductase subunit AhpC